ncbi:MAG: HAD-IIB family hydrolase, partial [Luminiphilus sp.]
MSIAVIYTDLDGTLLDHHTYSFAEALETVHALRDRGIPIVPCTSKTRAETAELMNAAGLSGPMIVENGAAIWVPKDWGLSRPAGAEDTSEAWCHSFGPSRGMIRRQLAILNVE